MSNDDAIIATAMVGDSPLLYDTSTMGTNGSPCSIASAVPSTATRRFSYIPTTTVSKATIKDGWVVSASSSSTRPDSASTSFSPATTTQVAVFGPSATPLVRSKAQRMSSLYITIIVLVVTITAVAAVLVWSTWLHRRKKAGDQNGVHREGERRPSAATEKSVPREPELSWMTGPTLIPEKDPHWSARTLVSPSDGHPQRDLAARGLARGTTATAPPPTPPRSISRRQALSTARRRELPLPPAPFTPLVTPVSPVSPARGRREVIDEDEVLPVVDNDSY